MRRTLIAPALCALALSIAAPAHAEQVSMRRRIEGAKVMFWRDMDRVHASFTAHVSPFLRRLFQLGIGAGSLAHGAFWSASHGHSMLAGTEIAFGTQMVVSSLTKNAPDAKTAFTEARNIALSSLALGVAVSNHDALANTVSHATNSVIGTVNHILPEGMRMSAFVPNAGFDTMVNWGLKAPSWVAAIWSASKGIGKGIVERGPELD